MVRRLLSFWEGKFSGAMLNFRWVSPPKATFEDDFPFPKVGYVSSLCICSFLFCERESQSKVIKKQANKTWLNLVSCPSSKPTNDQNTISKIRNPMKERDSISFLGCLNSFPWISQTTMKFGSKLIWNPTVDGRNPASVNMVNIPIFAGFYRSQVVQDFFHQQ